MIEREALKMGERDWSFEDEVLENDSRVGRCVRLVDMEERRLMSIGIGAI